MQLNTTEKFLLLTRHPRKGRALISDMHMHHVIMGIQFLELSAMEAFTLGEKDRVQLNDDFETTDPVLTEVVAQIRKSRRNRKVRDWIVKLSGKAARHKRTFLEKMEQKGLIRIEKKKILGLIPYRKVYLEDHKTRDELIYVLRSALLESKAEHHEILIILGMIDACKMHKVLGRSKQEVKEIKKKLQPFLKENPVASDVKKSIEQVQAAIMASIAASTAAVSVTTSGS